MAKTLLLLGIESSCDETGVALVALRGDALPELLAHALYSQIDMHQAYGGVVPELASRDHIRRVLPLTQQVLREAGFIGFRVRHHGTVARIEVPPADIARLAAMAASLAPKIRAAGYTYVALDLDGYRTGSLNAVLKKKAEG